MRSSHPRMGDSVTKRWGRDAAGPRRVGAANGGGRTRIGIETQEHQRRRAPVATVCKAGCRPPVSAEPGHGGARQGGTIIARSGDYGNRHHSRQAPPVFPLVKLGQIVAAHQPDEAPFRPAPQDGREGIHGKASAQFPLYRRHANPAPSRLPLGRCEARGERGHSRLGFQRIAGRNQPPDLVQRQRLDGEEGDPPVPAMRGIETAAKQPGQGSAPVQGRTCPVPRTCHL